MFCTKCGKEISESAAFCQGCGNPIAGKVQAGVCPSCGTELPDTAAFCHVCGNPAQRSGATGVSRPTTAFAGAGRGFPVGSTLLGAMGAVLMLITLALDWYSIKCSGDDCWPGISANLDFGNLTSDTDILGFNWAGSGLPLVFIIVFASVTILSLGYPLLTRSVPRKLWNWLGSLSIVSLVISFVYVLVEALTDDSDVGGTLYNTPHVGWVLALVGAIAILVGAGMAKKRR